ncbi:CopD family protein [Streptomyces sp. GXMU-J5]|uniref:CopD family protein n=1 Tax=Streptomyces beihaiensis TaxID=2984495 RepID=A0ABT3TRU4_9ACTN|nr:CopD family protein [Streptomyces beihaiensis]MCX3059765.1 CopD family protein [Streptomyces beihaiensis]
MPARAGADAAARGPGAGRALAVLALVAAGALIPMLGPGVALHGTGEAAAPGVRGIALLRAVLFGALCVQAGEGFAVLLARRVAGAPLELLPRRWSPYVPWAGFAAALGLAAVVASGNLVPHGLDDLDVGGLYGTREGALALVEVNGFLAAALCARSRRPDSALLPLAAVVVAEALRAHPTYESTELFGSALTLVHLTCAVLWTGGLLYVLRTLRVWRAVAPGAGTELLSRYARVAAVLLAAITATGTVSTLRRMPPGTVLGQLTDTAYGRTLLAKLLLVAVVAALALAARLRLRGRGDGTRACVPARAEVWVLAVVVVVSALLTALPVPIRW